MIKNGIYANSGGMGGDFFIFKLGLLTKKEMWLLNNRSTHMRIN